ncbi:agmatinase [Pseudoponticoccus marisrubri]|uniref:Agmatinase n=1 Tax=Pseudoponticoccus marisrubri TaxID=1685382 RepID=A0A0W7WN06_9RHOB|nr:agmatinase [Pseudoponticoccus marisrubri]KUF11963.1 agmatinase [Pseudoponticoccus marisrubri]
MSLEDAKTQIDHAFTREDLKGPSFENVFAGAPSFLRRRYSKDLAGVDIAVTGLPFDQAVTNRPGTRLGPRAIREASLLQPCDAPYGWGYDVLSEFAIADAGDMAFDYAAPAEVPERIRAHVAGILQAGAACIALGGDHSVTHGALRAHAATHGPLSVIQFDAHTDTWADDDATRVDHGTFMYKAVQEGIVVPDRSVQIGIRTDNPDTLGFRILDARAVHGMGPEAVARRVHEIVGGHPCYLTFDIDALDPAFAPGTGTPVWGGLSSHQAAVILRGLAGIDLKGGDVVEVSPPFDPAGATAVAAAHVATELLCLWGWTRR